MLCDSDTALIYHIDVNRSDSLCMSHQENGTDTTDVRPRTFKSVTARKANTYAAESVQLNAVLTPFCVDSNGSFCPRDATYNPAGKLNPTVILNLLFPKGQSKNPTTIPHSVEEGLLDMLAARAADQDIGEGAYDKSLSFHTAAAMFASQSARLIAYHAIRGSAQAALRSLVRFSRFH